MECFKENCCRLCDKILCCETCRFQHEEKVHNVNPECEICIYGRTTINKASLSLLTHIKNCHWPLHCVFCKKVFSSLDDLVPHDKCAVNFDKMKMEGTPKTPLMNNNKASPVVTPFYRSIKATLVPPTVTSTPLVPKEEIDGHEKITPINQTQISSVLKSNLKLTGSSNLNESKKSERRVTFSETPSVSELPRKPKYLPLEKTDEEVSDESSDDLYTSVEEIFKIPPDVTDLEEKENMNNEIVVFDKRSEGTIWESALTKLNFNGSNSDLSKSNISVALQINVFNNTVKSEDSSNLICNEGLDASVQTKSLWSSMTDMVKSVVSNISLTAHNSFPSVSMKRAQPDDEQEPSLKRIKLTDIKCRRPIRDIGPLYHIRPKPRFANKATQTDESWLFYQNNRSI